MKTSIKRGSTRLLLLIVSFCTTSIAGLQAETFSILHSFTGVIANTNADGASPLGGLILLGNSLYATASGGGSGGRGTVFKLNTDGTGFTVLHNFSGLDGAAPVGALILSGNTLYGTTGGGGGGGTVFGINTDGTGFTNLHSFQLREGIDPVNGLILLSNTLYGTASYGGPTVSPNNFNGDGSLFKLNTDGTQFSILHIFSAATLNPVPSAFGWLTNSDGITPGSLTLVSNRLYGVTSWGGEGGCGVIFTLDPDGTGFTNLRNFPAIGPTPPYPAATIGPNSDGGGLGAALLQIGPRLYGTASQGGNLSYGTAFAINTDGTGFTILHTFSGKDDGGGPSGRLLALGSNLYGTTASGGALGGGVVFTVNLNGTGFTVLHNLSQPFTTDFSGGYSQGDLILSGNTLYGATRHGGSFGNGSVFSILLHPQLAIITNGPNLVLSWPTNFAAYTLQSTSDLDPAAGWRTVNLQTPPDIVGGQYTATLANSPIGPQQFFRLSQP